MIGILDEVFNPILDERSILLTNLNTARKNGITQEIRDMRNIEYMEVEDEIKRIHQIKDNLAEQIKKKFKNPHGKTVHGHKQCECDWCYSATEARKKLLGGK